jgi:hypothetical protein
MIQYYSEDMYVKRVSIFLTVVAIIAGMVGCVGGDGNNGGSYTLIIDFTTGGIVTVDDVPIPGKAILPYNAGTVVSLNATPSAGYRFVEWTGNVSNVADVEDATTTITMNGNYTVTANFEKEQYDLSGSWTLHITPQDGEEEGPYCIDIEQSDNTLNYLDWHKVYCTLVHGNLDGDSIVFSGESTYYGNAISYSAVAIIDGDTMSGTYNYTGAYNEEGDFWAMKAACKMARGWVRVADIQGEHVLTFWVWDLIDDGISITSATVTGPNIIGTLSLNITGLTGYSLGETQPIAGQMYTFSFNYSDGAMETTSAYVRETFVDFPTHLSPADGEVIDTLTPTFSWQPPPCGCQGYYRIWILDSQNNDVWSVYLPKETTSVVYNFDGRGNALESGETYQWRLITFDEGLECGTDNNVWLWTTFTIQ